MTETMSALQFRAMAMPKRNKYGNKAVMVDGKRFDSMREARRYGELRGWLDVGKIRDLTRQPVFILAPSVKIEGEAKKRPAVRYRADFAYTDARTGKYCVEDVKSTPTAMSKEFRRVQHLMQSVHGISVRVVK